MIHELTDANFDAFVADETPCVILFTAKWCTLCDKMMPAFEELSHEYEGRVKFCSADTEVNKGLRIKFAVAALPYVVYVTGNTASPLFDAIATKDALRERINYALAGKKIPGTRTLTRQKVLRIRSCVLMCLLAAYF